MSNSLVYALFVESCHKKLLSEELSSNVISGVLISSLKSPPKNRLPTNLLPEPRSPTISPFSGSGELCPWEKWPITSPESATVKLIYSRFLWTCHKLSHLVSRQETFGMVLYLFVPCPRSGSNVIL